MKLRTSGLAVTSVDSIYIYDTICNNLMRITYNDNLWRIMYNAYEYIMYNGYIYIYIILYI